MAREQVITKFSPDNMKTPGKFHGLAVEIIEAVNTVPWNVYGPEEGSFSEHAKGLVGPYVITSYSPLSPRYELAKPGSPIPSLSLLMLSFQARDRFPDRFIDMVSLDVYRDGIGNEVLIRVCYWPSDREKIRRGADITETVRLNKVNGIWQLFDAKEDIAYHEPQDGISDRFAKKLVARTKNLLDQSKKSLPFFLQKVASESHKARIIEETPDGVVDSNLVDRIIEENLLM